MAGLIAALQDKLCWVMIHSNPVEATLRLFAPEIDLPDIDLDEIRPKPLPPRHHAFKGQVTRLMQAMLRTDDARDGKAIAIRLMAVRELNLTNKVLCKAIATDWVGFAELARAIADYVRIAWSLIDVGRI